MLNTSIYNAVADFSLQELRYFCPREFISNSCTNAESRLECGSLHLCMPPQYRLFLVVRRGPNATAWIISLSKVALGPVTYIMRRHAVV